MKLDVKVFTFIEEQVSNAFKENNQLSSDDCNTNFLNDFSNLSDDDFEVALICNGYIPDLYAPDSSEETLFSKFVEISVAAWSKKIGLPANNVKQK